MTALPQRLCVGCKAVFQQSQLVRFVRERDGWRGDPPAARRRLPGRGVYLCSRACGERAAKNRRYPGLAASAAEYGFWRDYMMIEHDKQ